MRLVVVSYGWQQASHPDPDARTLLAVADALLAAQTRHAVTLFTRESRQPLPQEVLHS